MQIDYLIVGSGLTGAVLGRMLHDVGKLVLIVDRRNHSGGNVHDHFHPSGIRIHTYGPHYFRTSSEKIWRFVTSFADFYSYEARLQSFVDGRHERWPVTKEYITRVIGENWSPDFQGTPHNFEEASLAMMPRLVYEKFVQGYSEKQWGVPAQTLSANLAGRFAVGDENDCRLKKHTHQGIPTNGYAAFMTNLLRGIPLLLNFDYLRERTAFTPRAMTIFTGPIDEYFGFHLGKLCYRGQRRAHTYHADAAFLLPCGQVNNPDPNAGPHVRTLEWKQMMEPCAAANIKGTVLTTETPFTPENPEEYEYPFPDDANKKLFFAYRERARAEHKVLFCGRLGEYRYYDMDQAIARAMMLAEKILGVADVATAIEAIRDSSAAAPEITPPANFAQAEHKS